jgi:prefoldin beta subunit
MSREEIPPWLKEQLARFDQLQQNLQAVLLQKQQVDLELTEIEKATTELKKAGTDELVYKSAGSLLIKVKKDDMLKELDEQRELANTRSIVLAKQETRLKENVKDLQLKINEAVRSRGQSLQPPESSA